MTRVTIEVDAVLHITCEVEPVRRGVYHAAPERCYPDDGGEVDVIHVSLQPEGGKGIELPVAVCERIALELRKEIQRLAHQEAEEQAADRLFDILDDDNGSH